MYIKKEFPINDSIRLKLEWNNNKDKFETVIYVAGERFRQCKHLLLISPQKILEPQCNSIEDASQFYQKQGIPTNDFALSWTITPEQEFQAHCSNIQAWVENDYDTRLLHANLSFSLLNRLKEFNLIAKDRFKEEVIKRLISGSYLTRKYILENGELEDFFFYDLSEKEHYWIIEQILQEDEYEAFLDLFGKNIGKPLSQGIEMDGKNLVKVSCCLKKSLKKLAKLRDLNLVVKQNESIPTWIGKLEKLQLLKIRGTDIRDPKLLIVEAEIPKIPKSISNLKSLENLQIECYKINSIPEDLSLLINLKNLVIKSTNIKVLPRNFGNLQNLRYLDLCHNELEKLPPSFSNLKNIKSIDLSNNPMKDTRKRWQGKNHINRLPHDFGKLKSLEELDLSYNSIDSLPKSFENLKKLKVLNLKSNNLKSFPEALYNVKSLVSLNLSNNYIPYINEKLGNLVNLRHLNLNHNPLEKLPTCLENHPKLK